MIDQDCTSDGAAPSDFRSVHSLAWPPAEVWSQKTPGVIVISGTITKGRVGKPHQVVSHKAHGGDSCTQLQDKTLSVS